MKLIKHTNYIYEYENFVDTSTCNYIVDVVESQNIKYFLDEKNIIKYNKALSLTDCNIKKIQEIDLIAHNIFSKAHFFYLNDNKFLYFLKRDAAEDIQNLTSRYIYRMYDKNDYYDWHVDAEYGKQCMFTYLVYLNDNFDGGETYFLHEKIKITPKQGSIICWISDYRTIHKGSKIKTGKKKILVTGLFNKIHYETNNY
jgi:hypothetical protein